MDVQELLDRLEASMSPSALRELAATLLRLADSIEQEWSPAALTSNYPMFSKTAWIERNAMALAFSATKEEQRAKLRAEAIGVDLVGVPAWNILLELFKQFAGSAKVSTKSLQIISKCPETTALRIIDRLEERDLVTRSTSEVDRRVTFVTLTTNGVNKVGSVLDQLNV